MLEYNIEPSELLESKHGTIPAFSLGGNLDETTVESFGNEWEQFSNFDSDELALIGQMYFTLLMPKINDSMVALDAGCGTGRWSKHLSPHLKWVEAIDPSNAVYSAKTLLRDCPNVRVTRAGIDEIPFSDCSFDLVFSVGVLHHMPNTLSGIRSCVRKLKPGGWLYVYLYYALDNRGVAFRILFHASNFVRRVVASLPNGVKNLACDVLAVTCYMPFVMLARSLRSLLPNSRVYKAIPLQAYSDKSFWVIRNDCRDRFGTPLEQRFTKSQIHEMLTEAGLSNIEFSDDVPFWCAIGQRLTATEDRG